MISATKITGVHTSSATVGSYDYLHLICVGIADQHTVSVKLM